MAHAPSTNHGRTARKDELRAFKRQGILDAARAVFDEKGFVGANMRAIASRAGYAPGTLYLHYRGKEEIYADLLADSLSCLHRTLRDCAAAGKRSLTLRAPFDHYIAHPADLGLGAALLHSTETLPAEIERQINGRLIAALSLIANAIHALTGASAADANREAINLAAHQIGVLLLQRSGRLGMLGFAADDLVERYISRLTGDQAA